MTKKIALMLVVLTMGFSTVPAQFQTTGNGTRFATTNRFVKAADINLTGKWNLTVDLPDQQLSVSLDINQSEKTFSGTMSSQLGEGKITNGKIEESAFSAVIQANIQGQAMDIQMSGKLADEKISGTLSIPNAEAFPFNGVKAKS